MTREAVSSEEIFHRTLKISFTEVFHESLKKQFNWNLMLRYTVKLTLNEHFMKYSEKKISQCILPFNK